MRNAHDEPGPPLVVRLDFHPELVERIDERAYFVVAVNDDGSVRALKGAGRPILAAADRAELVAALRAVDYVVTFPETTVARLLEHLKPDVHCKGTDYTVESVPERAIVKTKRALANAFAVIKDDRETTCIIDEAKLGAQKFLGYEGDWRMITFDMVLPLSLVGFFAAVSGALADAGVNIFTLSAYTTDHVFVKNPKLEKEFNDERALRRNRGERHAGWRTWCGLFGRRRW